MNEWDQGNAYYNPESVGATMVATLDVSPGYEFDIVLLVRENATGLLWAAHDSGCSCPTPFEGLAFPWDFVLVDSVAAVEPLIAMTYGGSATELADFRRKVREALDR